MMDLVSSHPIAWFYLADGVVMDDQARSAIYSPWRKRTGLVSVSRRMAD